MLELQALSQWQCNVSPQSGRAHTSLGTEKPKTPFISMAAQTGMGPGPGEEGAHLSWAGHSGAAGTRAARKQKACIWSAAGTSAKTRGTGRSRLGQGPETGGGESETGREGSQGSRGSAQNKAGKGEKGDVMREEKQDKNGERGPGQARCLVSGNESGRKEKPQVKDKRVRSQELGTGPRKSKRIVRKGKTNEQEGKKSALWQRTKSLSFQSWDLNSTVLPCTCPTPQGPPSLGERAPQRSVRVRWRCHSHLPPQCQQPPGRV